MRYRHEVYYNLHKKCLSLRNISSGLIPDPSGKRPGVSHMESVIMHDVKFVVQPAGNAKVRATGRKNVHAFVRGTHVASSTVGAYRLVGGWIDQEISSIMSDPTMQKITYNPYKYDSFVVSASATDRNLLTPVYSADKVYIVGRDIYAVGAK